MSFEELKFYYALYLCDGVGAQRLIALRTYFGNAETAYHASAAQLRKVPGLGKGVVEQLQSSKEGALRKSEDDLAALAPGVSILTFFDPEYPDQLKNIYSPPALLFLSGTAALLQQQRNIAVIGSRRMTDYGKRVVESLGKIFAEHNVVITSGFASGIDTAAHRSVFEAGGSTIAVLGSGLDVIYPSTNKAFSKELTASGRGLIISELPFGAKPDAKNFPWRNRIVSGLCSACVIIESEESGGSMITASIAFDQNREVFALVGDIGRPMSKGPNMLLVENRAKPFRTAEDIIRAMEWKSDNNLSKPELRKNKKVGLTGAEYQLVDILEHAGEPIHIDILSERSGIEVQTALVHLLELEFRDIVRQLPGKHFSTIF